MKVSETGVLHFYKTPLAVCLPADIKAVPRQSKEIIQMFQPDGSDNNKHCVKYKKD
jgi:hypothetical protein